MKNKGFTLIEMAIVICIIIILALMMFRMVGAVGKANDVAETRARLEKVGNALEEFRAIYGKYPPVPVYENAQPMGYGFPDYAGWGGHTTSGEVDMDTANRRAKKVNDENPAWSKARPVYTFGLCSYFLPRFNGTAEKGPNIFVTRSRGNKRTIKTKDGTEKVVDDIFNQWANFNYSSESFNGDSAHDLAAVRRILPYLDGKLGPDGRPAGLGIIEDCNGMIFSIEYDDVTNRNYTIRDAWYQELRYESRPPYDTFKIWSVGPDGQSGTDDDIIAGE